MHIRIQPVTLIASLRFPGTPVTPVTPVNRSYAPRSWPRRPHALLSQMGRDLVSIGMKNAPGTVVPEAFCLVAGVGFEPTTSGL
jgi:hypothetical protein